jgi:cytochrome oxidase assembly protein ShyY1
MWSADWLHRAMSPMTVKMASSRLISASLVHRGFVALLNAGGTAVAHQRQGEQHVEAFAVPIKPGKEETWKSWVAETNGARKAEFDEMNERMGLTTHAAWLQQNPDGSQLAVVVLDGPGASEFLGKLATSDHAFDTWFRTNVEDIHPMDFSAPPPPAPVRFL